MEFGFAYLWKVDHLSSIMDSSGKLLDGGTLVGIYRPSLYGVLYRPSHCTSWNELSFMCSMDYRPHIHSLDMAWKVFSVPSIQISFSIPYDWISFLIPYTQLSFSIPPNRNSFSIPSTQISFQFDLVQISFWIGWEYHRWL